MFKKLIINGDDLGMTPGVTWGIFMAHEQGILTSTTAMMNMPYVEKSLNKAADYPKLGLGVHLNVTAGAPLTGGKTFITDDGTFKKPGMYEGGVVNADPEEIRAEWTAQIERFIAITGHKPDHLDSHHHIHNIPAYHDIIRDLCARYDVPLRQSDKLLEDKPYVRLELRYKAEELSYKTMERLCDHADELGEIMFHPAFIDKALCDCSSYNTPRMLEQAFLISDEAKRFIEDYGITLTTYADI